MVGQYRQDLTDWIDDGMYGGDNDRFPKAIQDRIEATCQYNGWARTRDEIGEKVMGAGWGIGRGWLPIVEELDREIAEIDPDYRINQIKEKFGGLRYYIELVTDDDEERNHIHELVNEAEAKCDTICEICGEEGKISGKRWLKCRCKEHAREECV